MLLTTSYLDPDLDGVACAIAYAELLTTQNRPATPVFFGTPSDEARWVAQQLDLVLPGPSQLAGTEVILVDASDRNSLEIPDLVPSQVVEIIDHRQTHEAEVFANARVQIELVGSCSSLITEKFINLEVKPTRISAALLSTAIASNTLNFQSKTTTDRDRAAFAWLKPFTALPNDFVLDMFRAKSDLAGKKLIERLENEYARAAYGGRKVLFCQLELVGAHALVQTRGSEIMTELERMAGEFGSNYYLCSLIELDPDHSSNIFLTDHAPTQKLLSEILGIPFGPDHIALRPGLIMRKEVLPLLKYKLEK